MVQPREPLLSSKGIVVALADGVSSSEVSQDASETSVAGFLQDYYSTSEAWSVANSIQRVLYATNSWLYAQNRAGPHRYNIERGYVCTFSAVILKATTAHILSIGDTRVYRLSGDGLEQLTEDHRVWLSDDKSYLSRALGMREGVDIDYRKLALAEGDTFVLATDGVYEFARPELIIKTIEENGDDLNAAAQRVVQHALERGSDDNLTIQIVRIDQLPLSGVHELHQQADALPFPPEMGPRSVLDGYRIIREVHHSSRSHVYLAEDEQTLEQVILKLPSVDKRNDPTYLEALLMEEWVARRVNSVHLLKAIAPGKRRNYLYTVSEYIEGKSLDQWMRDNSRPDMESVRNIIEQIAKGLQALHRQEMLHQDLRPANIMIDTSGTVKIIDFGAVRVAGIAETEALSQRQHILGTMQYTAPEYFLGEPGSAQSDIFSLGVIAYQMLSGRQPYGNAVARATTPAAQRKLAYRSVRDDERSIPAWVDSTLRRAVHANPSKRYSELSEFVYDLRHPNPAFMREGQAPLVQRNPILFWKTLSMLLLIMLLVLLATHPLVGA